MISFGPTFPIIAATPVEEVERDLKRVEALGSHRFAQGVAIARVACTHYLTCGARSVERSNQVFPRKKISGTRVKKNESEAFNSQTPKGVVDWTE